MTQLSKRQNAMQNRIIIFLENERSAWVIRDAEGQTQCVLDGDLSQLHPGDKDEIGVVLPAADILLTEADLPRLSTYRLQLALPFALEEQLLEDLDDLHFAPGPYLTTEVQGGLARLPVAIVKKTLLEEWLQRLAQQGIQPDWLTSAVFTLPWEENQWQLRTLEHTVLVRTGPYAGFSAERTYLDTLLRLKHEETQQPPEKAILYCDVEEVFSLGFTALPLHSVKLKAEEMLSQAATALEKHAPLNLLQGPYASKRKFRAAEKNKRVFRLAGFAFALWLGLLFVGKITSWMVLSWEHHHLQNSLMQVYQTHFPDSPISSDPKRKLEAQLKKALTENNQNRLFQWLGDLSKASAAGRLQGFRYQNKQLSLDWTAPTFTALDDFILSLKSQGVEVRQQSAVLAGNQVKAVLVIEEGSAS